jgi:Mg-chelatase subunit ChlD
MKKSGKEESKLMSSVDQSANEENNGKLAEDYMNNSIGSFTPDIVFQNIVNNYKNAKKLYGETIIRELTDFEPGYIEKNVKIPEFQTELKKNIASNVKDLKDKGILNSKFVLTEQGIDLAAINICESELDKLKIKGFGNKKTKEKDIHGEKDSYAKYNSQTRYKDVSVAQTIKNATRRKHNIIQIQDIKAYERKKTGRVDIIYCIDSSGSMKGDKIGLSKRAGVALSYKAIKDSNRVGLLVFDSEIRNTIQLTKDFNLLLSELVRIKARNQTDIKQVISNASEMLAKSKNTKHIVVLSDAMPNVGETEDVYKAAAIAASRNITISFIGIDLDKQGTEIANKIVDIGKGRLYKVKKMDNIDSILLEDYEFARRG